MSTVFFQALDYPKDRHGAEKILVRIMKLAFLQQQKSLVELSPKGVNPAECCKIIAWSLEIPIPGIENFATSS